MARNAKNSPKTIENSEKPIINPHKFKPEVKQLWLETYVDNGYNIKKACATVGISVSTFYRNLSSDPELRASLNETNDIALEAVLPVLLEALNSSDWGLKKWAVEQLKRSTKLTQHGLSELANKEGKSFNDQNFIFDFTKDNIKTK